MAINYTVQAEVVDLRSDAPVVTDEFFVDTNVWLWVAYTRGTSTPAQAMYYPPYLSRARRAGAKLRYCPLCQSELAHNIEKAEKKLFENTNPRLGQIWPKEFRHNFPAERAKVVAEVQAAWGQVTAMATSVDVQIDEAAATVALQRFQSQPLDGYDLFMIEAAMQGGICQVMSDDGDFCTVSGIRLFTANLNVVTAARKAGKFIVR